MTCIDRFETQVYYAEAIKRFLTIDRRAKPTHCDWVAVRRMSADRIKIQRYRGQSFIGVVRVLRRYSMSERWNPRTIQAYSD
jgi:hypothetical protein